MIDFFKKVFGEPSEEAFSKQTDIQHHDPRIAACALLLEMAHIDGEFTFEEKENLISLLRNEFELSSDEVHKMIEKAEEDLSKSLDLWKFADMINENFSIEEKLRVVELLWELVYTDGKLDKHEDYLIHKLAHLLRITHSQLIDAKLNVLKKHKN
jgi:uncharacterized tellurite resistance protein B-like protein